MDGAAGEGPGSPPPDGSDYRPIGAFQGSTYHRNAFARGTAQEVDVLTEVLGLRSGMQVLDVGCGNGRHVRALRDAGIAAVGLDLSVDVLAGADDTTGLVAGRSQALPFPSGHFDAAYSVCQGGFGLSPAMDESMVGETHRVLRTGGRVAFTAFSLVYAIRYLVPGESIDVAQAMHHHVADVRGPGGRSASFDLWTAAYSVPHLRLLLRHHGFRVLGVAGVESGHYQHHRVPTIDDPEVLIWAERR